MVPETGRRYQGVLVFCPQEIFEDVQFDEFGKTWLGRRLLGTQRNLVEFEGLPPLGGRALWRDILELSRIQKLVEVSSEILSRLPAQ